jgi:hypothetical protein
MTRLFKGLALFIALACLIWLGVLWHWQRTQYQMSTTDVVVYLGALPLTVFALVLLGRWAWRGAAQKSAAKASVPAPVAPAGASAHAATASSADEAARHSTCQLLAAHARTAAGSSVDDCLHAAETHKPAPALEATLRDQNGLPVLCAKVADLAVEAVQADLLSCGTPASAGAPQQEQASARLKRCLALLRDPVWAAVAALAPWSQVLGGSAQALGGNAQALAADDVPARAQRPISSRETLVRVLVAWPAGLDAPQQALAANWLGQQLQRAGAGLVAPQRWSVTSAGEAGAAALSGPELWLQADAVFEAMRRDERQDLVLLLAAHSDISDEVVEHLQAAGMLFSSERPTGVIPGEAAVALLLAPAEWPADSQVDKPMPHLHRVAAAQRNKSVDAPGRVSHELAPLLVQQALQAARLTAGAIGGVASDADQHTPRGAELFAAMLSDLPHLDAADDMRMWGQLGGRNGACGTLLSVAMAASQAGQTQKPCLALSVGDAQWRAAIVARPAAPPPPHPAAQSGGPSPQAA